MGKPDHPTTPEDSASELARLQSAYDRLGPEEPPALIDLAILNRARRETSDRKSPVGKMGAWVAGLSTASLLVIALSLALQQKLEQSPQPAPAEPARMVEDKAMPLAKERASPAEADMNADAALFTPEVWLERIEELRQQGMIEAATRELERLQATYPAFPLPEDLLRALDQSDRP